MNSNDVTALEQELTNIETEFEIQDALTNQLRVKKKKKMKEKKMEQTTLTRNEVRRKIELRKLAHWTQPQQYWTNTPICPQLGNFQGVVLEFDKQIKPRIIIIYKDQKRIADYPGMTKYENGKLGKIKHLLDRNILEDISLFYNTIIGKNFLNISLWSESPVVSLEFDRVDFMKFLISQRIKFNWEESKKLIKFKLDVPIIQSFKSIISEEYYYMNKFQAMLSP